MNPIMPPKFPLILTLLFGGLLVWLWLTDHVFRSGGLMILIPLWFILVGLWWALRQRGARLKRLGFFVLGFITLVAAFRFLVRYEGSADGSAFPSLVWRWQKKQTLSQLPSVVANAAADVPAPSGAADMPRFLGTKGDGVLPEPQWQTDWSKHPPREVWRIAVGDGWSGFAVSGGRALTQEQRGEEECVTCYELATGKLLWSHADKARFDEAMGGIGPRATPTVDGAKGIVFTIGGTGILNCLDLKTGVRRWSRQVIEDCGAGKNLQWGKSASPVLVGEFVIASGGENGVSLIAYRQDNGEIAWKGGDDGGSYSTPVLMTLAGREQIVTLNAGSVTGHDPLTGTVLWKFEWPGMFPKVAQAVQLSPERLLITSSYGLKSHMLEIKAGADSRMNASALWKSSAPRTKFSSASVFGTHAYALDEGTLCSVDLTTGERGWREGRYGFGQQIRVGDTWLLMQAEKGFVALIKANPEKLEEVSRLDALHAKAWNPPTLAGRWLLLRNDLEAVCYELPTK